MTSNGEVNIFDVSISRTEGKLKLKPLTLKFAYKIENIVAAEVYPFGNELTYLFLLKQAKEYKLKYSKQSTTWDIKAEELETLEISDADKSDTFTLFKSHLGNLILQRSNDGKYAYHLVNIVLIL